MTGTPTRLYTAEEARQLPDANAYELVDGELRERGVGAESSWIEYSNWNVS